MWAGPHGRATERVPCALRIPCSGEVKDGGAYRTIFGYNTALLTFWPQWPRFISASLCPSCHLHSCKHLLYARTHSASYQPCIACFESTCVCQRHTLTGFCVADYSQGGIRPPYEACTQSFQIQRSQIEYQSPSKHQLPHTSGNSSHYRGGRW